MCCRTEPKSGIRVAGIQQKRGCTDVIFLLLFVISWIAIIIIISKAGEAGADPNRIVRGVNLQGQICGKDSGVKDKPLAAWPNPLYYEYQICVSSCNETHNPLSTEMSILYPSTEFLYYCIPGTVALWNSTLLDMSGEFDAAATAAQNAFADLFTAWVIILVSPIIALVMSFLVVNILRRVAGFLVFVLIMLVLAGFIIAGAALMQAASEADASISPERAKALKALGIICFVIAGIFFVVCLSLRRRILIAIGVVEVAGAALDDMKSLLLFPLIPFFIALCYFAFWIFVALYLFSVANPVTGPLPVEITKYQFLSPVRFRDQVYTDAATNAAAAGFPFAPQLYMPNTSNPVNGTSYAFNEEWRPALAFHFFHLLWNMQFLFYFGYLVFAGATADWYFSETAANGEDKKVALAPVTRAVGRTTRYHLGTVAITSLIIAIIQFIRATVAYIQRKTRSNPPNQVQRCVFCMIQCCLKCIECCMDKINKNALIWTAIYGDGFVVSACSSFALIWRNLARVAAINLVSTFLLMIAKLAATAITAGICCMILIKQPTYAETVSSPIMPTFVIAMIAWTTIGVFMSVFNSVVDTIFFCFLVDEDANKGDMRAPDRLKRIIQDNKVASQKEFDDLSKDREERGAHNVKVAPSVPQQPGAHHNNGNTLIVANNGNQHTDKKTKVGF